ncbi:helix-turn-helix domain-containing protein [Vibrio litoralis]|jgi:transcriptional regulator with XRE-family HTH domain|uniref:helix-turn-helix domain-containing protein n=1 Tax=Vibrio litoralis TaxID=335972 RepID=UPI001866D79D|nr:helix-turn-helix transcriptional regulator [Vibrio litoralis]
MTDNWTSSIDYISIGDRLRAYRIGASLQAEDLAAQLGVSRAVIYRIERGEIVKIDTLDRIAQVLGTSLASLLGVESEYYPTPQGLFERMRQLEKTSDRILAHFDPISLLLTSDEYLRHLPQMLLESTSRHMNSNLAEKNVEELIGLLSVRRQYFKQRKPHIISLIGVREIEQFIHTGLVGRLDLPKKVHTERVEAAKNEVLYLADLMEDEPINVQIGLVNESMPSFTFQVMMGREQSVLVQSPFKLGEMPNIANGIGMVTVAPEAVKLHEDLMLTLWKTAYKGKAGANMLRKLVSKF